MNKNKYVEYDWYQMEQIRKGLEKGLDVSVYTNPEYDWYQMEKIRYGLEEGLDVSVYANPEYDWHQMEQIRRGLEESLDVSVYTNPEYNWYQMEQIRLGLEKGLNVSVYANPEYKWYKMKEIRWSLEYKIDSNKPLKTQIKYGFKAFNKDMTCRGFQYEIGKRYTMEETPNCCVQGFHFCLNLEDCYYYYPKESCVICKVEILGDIDTVFVDSKCCTNDIRILERI